VLAPRKGRKRSLSDVFEGGDSDSGGRGKCRVTYVGEEQYMRDVQQYLGRVGRRGGRSNIFDIESC